MTALKRILITALSFLLFSPLAVEACTCARGFFGFRGGCDRSWNSGQVIFLGKVTAKLDLAAPNDQGFRDLSAGYAVHFSVSERFNDGAQPAAEMVVYTGSGTGDCGYPFVVGANYLVYASGPDDHLYSGICTQTRPAVLAGGVIQQLRAIRDKGHGDELFGTVATWPRGLGSGDVADSKPLASVPIRVTGGHGTSFSATTDEYGAFAFAALPPDTYSVAYDVPPGYSLPALKTGDNFSVTLDASDGAAPGCALDAFPMPGGRVSGTVVDLAGRPIAGFVSIEPADSKDSSWSTHRTGLPGCDTEEGNFLLPLLPPGRYRLVFIPKDPRSDNAYAKFFWPSNAEVLELAFGKHIDDVRFEVPLSLSEQLARPK